MFTAGPLDIRITVEVPGQAPASPVIDSTTSGATALVEFRNRSTVPQDVEIEVAIANGLLSFQGLGATWAQRVNNIPQILKWSSAYQVRKALVHAGASMTGSETVSVVSVRYRPVGTASWTSYVFPAAGNAVVVTVN